MASSAAACPKIRTKISQPVPAGRRRTRAAAGGKRAAAGSAAVVTGVPRPCTRAQGRVVMETAEGITVYPARSPGDRWRAVWYENGTRHQCQAASEARLVAKLEKVAERLTTDAPNLLRPAADLIAWYLSPERHPRWAGLVAQAHAHPAVAVPAVPAAGAGRPARPGHPGRGHAARAERGLQGRGGRTAAAVHLGPGLRWGELAALTAGQIDVAARMVRVNRKVVEVGGALSVEAPKNRKWRRTTTHG